jgi:hypothetical protein
VQERVDLDADELLGGVTEQLLGRRRARPDQAVSVDLEHERVARIRHEPACPLLLADRCLGAGKRMSRGFPLVHERCLERRFGGRAAAEQQRCAREQEHQRDAADDGADRRDRGRGRRVERDEPGPSTELGVSDGAATIPLRKRDRAVGDTHVEIVGEPLQRGADKLVRHDRARDEPRESMAALLGGAERQAFGKDGNEGVDADPAVAGKADGSGEPGLPGRPGAVECLGERGVGAEVEHVQRRGGGLLPDEWEREGDADGCLDADLLGRLDLASLGVGDEGNPADRRDLGAGERHACVSRECLRTDRRRGVVCGADALQGKNGGSGALLQRRGGATGALARFVANVVVLGAPEGQRQRCGRESAEGECEG